MKGKIFYVTGHHRLVYVHDNDGVLLLLGGMTQFISDARTNIMRQVITVANFEKYKPIQINEDHLEQYRFMEQHTFIGTGIITRHRWKVTNFRHNSGDYLYLAKKLPLDTHKQPQLIISEL